MTALEIEPIAHPLQASVRVPGSKSLTNRALLVAALAHGATQLTNALFSDDSRYFAQALEALGFVVQADEAAGTIRVVGQGGRLPAASAELFIGNAGTSGGLTYYLNTYDPNAEINNADHTTEWLGRASGSYLFPYGIAFAANYSHHSGNPQRRTFIFSGGRQIPTITLPTEELGTIYQLPNIALLDLSVQKSFEVIRGQKATLRINVFNALNNNAITARTVTSGPNFGTVTNVLLPRIAELSVNYAF
jgi:hypothetical protein